MFGSWGSTTCAFFTLAAGDATGTTKKCRSRRFWWCPWFWLAIRSTQAGYGQLCAGSASLPPTQKLEQHLFISLLASVLLRLCRCALSGPGTTWCGGLGVGHGIATSASRDGMNNHSRPCSRVSYGGTKPTNQQLCSSLACLGAQRCYGPQPSHMTTSSPRM